MNLNISLYWWLSPRPTKGISTSNSGGVKRLDGFTDLASEAHKYQAGSLSSIMLLTTHQGAFCTYWPRKQSAETTLQQCQQDTRAACAGLTAVGASNPPQSPSPWERALQFTLPSSHPGLIGCLFYHLWVMQMRNKAPVFLPGFESSFNGNMFCNFPNTDDSEMHYQSFLM